MISFSTFALDDLQRLLELLDTEKAANDIEELKLGLYLRMDTQSERKDRLIWDVLSHPYCKIKRIIFTQGSFDLLLQSNVLTHVKRWCQEIPARKPRSLEIPFGAREAMENHKEFATLLREALEHPKNGVENLHFDCRGLNTPLCSSILTHVLKNPNNELRELRLSTMPRLEDAEAKSLCSGLASANCKLRTFRMDACEMLSSELCPVLEGLYESPCLEELDWVIRYALDDIPAVITRLTQLIERPGNHLRRMRIRLPLLEHDHFAIFARGLTGDHSRLLELQMGTMVRGSGDTLPVIMALRHPRNQLKTLIIGCGGSQNAEAFGESLKHPNCKLRTLTVLDDSPSFASYLVAEAIANALQFPNSLEVLHLDQGTTDGLLVFAESLRSQHNRLRELTLFGRMNLGTPERIPLLRALRKSNVRNWTCFLYGYPKDLFCAAFNAPFFQVLHTLLSVKHVPRLGQCAWLRILPVQDFILRIAATLGWPLDDLRLPLLKPPENECDMEA